MEVRVTVILVLMGFALGCVSATVDTVKVPTSSGILHGQKTTALQKPLMQFLGVPYAKPPVGDLRFKAPVEMIAKSTARDAASYAPSCFQPPHLKSVISPLLKPNQAEISEDCLYLNIFVPEVHDSNKPLPVMVWLAGEGFDYADAQQFDGSYLAVLGKVIVVTVNYRVSVFGFLSTLSEDAPGNVGLLDQRMALRWLKKNVEKFGGDVDNITLFGRFTGAMSIGIQAFSPLNKQEKLFHRAILQSGVPLGDWVFDKNPLNATLRLAETTNCLFSSLSDITSCLRRIPSDILLKEALAVPQRWRPVLDFDLIYEEPLKAAMKGVYEPIDILLGINNNEGSLCTIALNAMHSPLYPKILKQELTGEDLQELINGNMMEIFKKKDALLNKLAMHEYTSLTRQSKLRESFMDFCGDIYVTSHVQRLADILAEKNRGRVYMYEFAHRPSFSIHPAFVKAGHGDDVLFTLGLPLQLSDLSQEEIKLTRRAVEAVANFARKGNPNRESVSDATTWPEYTISGHKLMTFTTSKNQDEVVRRSSHDAAVSFWHDVIPSALHRSCPAAPTKGHPFTYKQVEAFYEGINSTRTVYFLGSFLSLPTAEYILLGLFCSAIFLFVSSTVAVLLLFKSKKYSAFQRLR